METLKFKKLENKFVINFPDTGVYRFDGELLTVKENYEEIVFEKLPKLIEKMESYYNTIDYVDEQGNHISIEEYTKQKNALLSKATYDEKSGFFNNIDDEYAYKKFYNKYKAYTLETYRPIKVLKLEEVVEIPIEDPKYIKPLRYFGGDITNPICQLLVNHLELIREIGTKHGFEEVINSSNTKGYKWTCEKYSGLEFFKINDTYVIKDYELNSGDIVFSMKGTYAECKIKLNNLIALIESKFLEQKSIIKSQSFKTKERGTMIEFINTLIYSLKNLDVPIKSKSFGIKQQLLKKAIEIKNNLIDNNNE